MKEKLRNIKNKLCSVFKKVISPILKLVFFIKKQLLRFFHFIHLDSLVKKLRLDKLYYKVIKPNFKKLILFIVITILIFYYGQLLCNGKYIFEKGRMELNFILIAIIIAFFYSVSGRTKLSLYITTTFVFIVGLINYTITSFRGTPLVPWDIFSVNVALTVLPTFKFQLTKKLALSILLFALSILLIKVVKINSYERTKIKVAYRLVVLLIVVGFTSNFFLSDYITKFKLDENWDPKEEYHNNGLVASLFKQARNLIIEKPDGYDIDTLTNIYDSIITPIVEKEENVQDPNIIVIMNESFADLKVVGDFPVSEDYMPFFHSLKENAIKGNLHMSVFGATTPNSEWEALTSNSMAFVPKRTVPYQQYVLRKSYSLASILKEQGYSATAIHCYHPQGYNRNLAYPRLGFDKFIYMEIMDNVEFIREYPSDACTYKTIIDLYENKAPGEKFFNFTLTMQNHGSYTDENFQNTISAANDQYPKLNQYLSLIKISDSALKDLIEYFSKEDEPTIIVLFGDHQPYVEDEFYNSILSQSFEDITSNEATERKFITPFLIWANYDIDEEAYSNISDLSANYLSSLVLDVAGLQKTPYLQYLDELREEIPIITGNGYVDKTGIYHNFDEETEYTPLIETYHLIQFNNMFDNKNKIKEFYTIP